MATQLQARIFSTQVCYRADQQQIAIGTATEAQSSDRFKDSRGSPGTVFGEIPNRSELTNCDQVFPAPHQCFRPPCASLGISWCFTNQFFKDLQRALRSSFQQINRGENASRFAQMRLGLTSATRVL